MHHAARIVHARGLLAEGRADEAVRLLEPLAGPPAEPGTALALALLARAQLLKRGDAPGAARMLAPFETLARREALAPAERAEVSLWLGWALAWSTDPAHDDARALHLLDESERLFASERDEAGRCWALMGRAQAYFALDEYPLMLRALAEASSLNEKVPDVQAALWLDDLSATAARFEGLYAKAELHAESLHDLAHRLGDAHAHGRAHAHLAQILQETGRPPERILAEAEEAAALLAQSAGPASAPLLAVRRTRLQALVVQGAWGAADEALREAMAAAGNHPTAPALLLVQRAHLQMRRGRFADAHRTIEQVLEAMHRRRHRLLRSAVTMLMGELLERQGHAGRARDWYQHARHSARESGYAAHELEAMLRLAALSAVEDDPEGAARLLREAEQFSLFFGLLPFAAPRYEALALAAQSRERPEEARALLAQALSAYSIMGDAWRAAHVQLRLAELERAVDPRRARERLEAAANTFQRLGAGAWLRPARARLDAWAEPPGRPEVRSDVAFAAGLARAAVSVELVAEAWLQAVESRVPAPWAAVYRLEESGRWSLVREHGASGEPPTFPEPERPEQTWAGVQWMRLRAHPGPAFFLAIRPVPEEALAAARPSLDAWLPVAALALDHALMRAQRLGDAGAREEGSEPAVDGIVAASPAMRSIVQQIRQIRASRAPVLLTGQPGTGRALAARAIHRAGPRRELPFVSVDCAAGATTGLFQALLQANGGTLLLRGIEGLSPEDQQELLRFLAESETADPGTGRRIALDVRVIATADAGIEERLREGRFREELYYRLNVVPIRVPPLRERRDEIPLLVRHFLRELRAPGAPVASITGPALDRLVNHAWPGNVRQLREELEGALLRAARGPTALIDEEHLSPAVRRPDRLPDLAGRELEDVLAGTEKALIERILAEHGGHITSSAQALGLTRQGLHKKIKRLGISVGQRRG